MKINKDNTYKVTFTQKENNNDQFTYSVLGKNFDKIKKTISNLGYEIESVEEVNQ